MKKLNKFYLSSIILLISFTAISTFVGCKTMPTGKLVDPINLLDEKSGFYIAIPKAADPDLIERIVVSNIPTLPKNNVDMICDRTIKIYSGITRNKKGTEIQSAIEGTIPTNLIPKLLTKKNGWIIKEFVSQNSVLPHVIYSANGTDISFPNSNVVCIGRDIGYMLNRHDLLSLIPEEVAEVAAPSDEYTSDLPKDIYDFLKGAENEIRFYANKPQSFLTVLTGTNLNLKLIDVKGAFLEDPNHSNQYILNIYFNFKENKYLKAGKALLNLAFGLTGSQSEVLGNTGLKITGIKISKDNLYKILVL